MPPDLAMWSARWRSPPATRCLWPLHSRPSRFHTVAFPLQLRRLCRAHVVLPPCLLPAAKPSPTKRAITHRTLPPDTEFADPCQGTRSAIETVAAPTPTEQTAILAAHSGANHFALNTFNFKRVYNKSHGPEPARRSLLPLQTPLPRPLRTCNAPHLYRTRLIFCAGCFLHSGHSQSPTGSSLIPTHSQWNH